MVTFPYAEQLKITLESMRPPPGLEDIDPDPVLELPFEPALEDADPSGLRGVEIALPPPPKSRFQITLKRMCDYGATDGCQACIDFDGRGTHTKECRERFRKLLEDAGELKVQPIPVITPTESDKKGDDVDYDQVEQALKQLGEDVEYPLFDEDEETPGKSSGSAGASKPFDICLLYTSPSPRD